jgi:hypothetical protein
MSVAARFLLTIKTNGTVASVATGWKSFTES